ncbi:hypothetical protein ACFSJU_13420 [Paradesertivirga mongoliensis]|uniref:Uncharacterized protein n=1 Tax=Paradesertivirga mongoliensis TaxID=2100740 RepID=A0ABW4ZNI8_9SPHI|nr:hypothetical protein [Pedobacter mongoliensis]
MGVYNQISGFAQDSIQLNIASHVQMHLDKNEMQYLNIRVGDEKGDGSLRIASDNTIQSLKLNVLAKSTVEILDSDIQKIDHKLSEGAIVAFRGKVLSLLNN